LLLPNFTLFHGPCPRELGGEQLEPLRQRLFPGAHVRLVVQVPAHRSVFIGSKKFAGLQPFHMRIAEGNVEQTMVTLGFAAQGVGASFLAEVHLVKREVETARQTDKAWAIG